MTQPWPVTISGNEIFLRPLRFRDRNQWNAVRAENRAWLAPWEATIPTLNAKGDVQDLPSYFGMVRTLNLPSRNKRGGLEHLL